MQLKINTFSQEVLIFSWYFTWKMIFRLKTSFPSKKLFALRTSGLLTNILYWKPPNCRLNSIKKYLSTQKIYQLRNSFWYYIYLINTSTWRQRRYIQVIQTWLEWYQLPFIFTWIKWEKNTSKYLID